MSGWVWLAAAVVVLVLVLRPRRKGPACRKCGWDQGGDACRTSHGPGARDPRTRMWTKPEWKTYQATGRKPKWDKS